jgi:hypothetical protein
MLRCHGALLAATLSFIVPSMTSAQPAVVDFDDASSFLFPSPYGESFGNSEGQVVISQNGVDVSVERFFLGVFDDFFRADVDGPLNDAFPTAPLEFNNISTRFDFSNLAFPVTQVTFEYERFGGSENFAVNDGTILELNITNLPSDLGSGVTASVDNGLITLSGPIDSFLIGGQELAIDNVSAVPEPTTLLLLGTAGALVLGRRRS